MPKTEENRNSQSELQEVTVTGNQEISPGIFLISWKRAHDFNPGQVVKITVDEAIPPRIYSICSGNDEPEISVLFNIK